MGQRTLVPDAGEVVLHELKTDGQNRLVMVLRSVRQAQRAADPLRCLAVKVCCDRSTRAPAKQLANSPATHSRVLPKENITMPTKIKISVPNLELPPEPTFHVRFEDGLKIIERDEAPTAKPAPATLAKPSSAPWRRIVGDPRNPKSPLATLKPFGGARPKAQGD